MRVSSASERLKRRYVNCTDLCYASVRTVFQMADPYKAALPFFTHSFIMKLSSRIKMYLRAYRFMAKGLASTNHPILAHVIPMRRCNLSCSYCNEYDDVSKPVPIEVMFERLDKLADLGTTAIIISGGEPLMHPQIEAI